MHILLKEIETHQQSKLFYFLLFIISKSIFFSLEDKKYQIWFFNNYTLHFAMIHASYLSIDAKIHSFMYSMHETSVAAPQDDLMDVDEIEPQGPRLPLLSAPINTNPYSLLDPHFRRNFFNIDSDFPNRAPFVTHPREVREIPIEVKDNNRPAGHSGPAPTIEDVTGTVHAHGPDTRGTVIIDDEDNEDVSAASTAQRGEQKDDVLDDGSQDRNIGPSAPEFENLPDYSNDIEEEMVRAAIEASRREVERAHNVCDANIHCPQAWPPCSLSVLNSYLS